MYADVALSEDTTTEYVRWEIVFSPADVRRLEALGGALTLLVEASHHVDVAGAYHEKADVEVAIYPHPGRRNRGQAKFKDFEARRRFVENLQSALTTDVTDFVQEAAPGSVPVDGHVIRRREWSAPAEPARS